MKKLVRGDIGLTRSLWRWCKLFCT